MFRLEPAMPVTGYKTYAISSPISTHFRDGTCEEADCPNWRHGWRIRAELLTPQQLHDIRNSGRHCTVTQVSEGETWLVFEAGQPCFASPHKVPLGRPELFVVRGGDWRGNPFGDHYQHGSPESWVDDFATHQDKVATLIERG